jgi:hypothetical protein
MALVVGFGGALAAWAMTGFRRPPEFSFQFLCLRHSELSGHTLSPQALKLTAESECYEFIL